MMLQHPEAGRLRHRQRRVPPDQRVRRARLRAPRPRTGATTSAATRSSSARRRSTTSAPTRRRPTRSSAGSPPSPSKGLVDMMVESDLKAESALVTTYPDWKAADMEVAPGLYQLKVPMPGPLEYVLSYLFPSDGGYTLVDPGWPSDDAFAALEVAARRDRRRLHRHPPPHHHPHPPRPLRPRRPRQRGVRRRSPPARARLGGRTALRRRPRRRCPRDAALPGDARRPPRRDRRRAGARPDAPRRHHARAPRPHASRRRGHRGRRLSLGGHLDARALRRPRLPLRARRASSCSAATTSCR